MVGVTRVPVFLGKHSHHVLCIFGPVDVNLKHNTLFCNTAKVFIHSEYSVKSLLQYLSSEVLLTKQCHKKILYTCISTCTAQV